MRILAISLSSRGFGFAVMEDGTTLVDWGVKSSKGDKNKDCLRQAKTMLELFHPSTIVLEDAAAKGSRRAARIQQLTEQITELAKGQEVRVKLFSQSKLMRQFFPAGGGTKHDLAVLLAARFPEELGLKLPFKRKPWQSEDARLDMFKAVALALLVQR
jgi:hypothetical protein